MALIGAIPRSTVVPGSAATVSTRVSARQSGQWAAPDQSAKPATSAHVAEVAKAQPQTPAEPSEHNWMKRSLDRASDVAHQSRERTKASQDP